MTEEEARPRWVELIPALRARAWHKCSPTNAIYDDMLQEGIIRMWRVSEAASGDRTDGYLLGAGVKAMQDVLLGKIQTGQPVQRLRRNLGRGSGRPFPLHWVPEDSPALMMRPPEPENHHLIQCVAKSLETLSADDRFVATEIMSGTPLAEIDRLAGRGKTWAQYRLKGIRAALGATLMHLIETRTKEA